LGEKGETISPLFFLFFLVKLKKNPLKIFHKEKKKPFFIFLKNGVGPPLEKKQKTYLGFLNWG